MAGRKIDIEERIERAKAEVTKAKNKYDDAVEALEKLMTRREEMRKKELMDAFSSSNRSFEEIMEYLKG